MLFRSDLCLPSRCKISIACFPFSKVAFVVLFPTKLALLHSDFNCKSFGISGFQKEFLTFPIWFYNIFLDYDVSLHILVVLVVTIPTSPRLSKTEFVDESYCISISKLLFDRIFKNREKKKKLAGPASGRDEAGPLGWSAGPPRAQAGPRPGAGRQLRAAARPAALPRPAHGRCRAGLTALFFFSDRYVLSLLVSVCSIDGLLSGRPGRLHAGPKPGTLLSAFSSPTAPFWSPL